MKVKMKGYDNILDLSGKNTLTLVGRPLTEFWSLVGEKWNPVTSGTINVRDSFVTNMTGQVANEIHIFPKVVLGKNFRKLCLQEFDGNICQLVWKFDMEGILEKPKPWYKKLAEKLF